MYIVKIPRWIHALWSNFVWKMPNQDKVLYLTFDDGPIPEVTPWVLEVLAKYQVKATFFCVGNNIDKHPDIYQQVVAAGHRIGNHTYNHLSGWKTDTDTYLNNVAQCHTLTQSNLFRPPYGRITNRQRLALSPHYRLIMWDVLSADFDTKIAPEKCLQNVIKNADPGSIIIFHDSLKAEKNMRYALPRVLEYFKAQGYVFKVL